MEMETETEIEIENRLRRRRMRRRVLSWGSPCPTYGRRALRQGTQTHNETSTVAFAAASEVGSYGMDVLPHLREEECDASMWAAAFGEHRKGRRRPRLLLQSLRLPCLPHCFFPHRTSSFGLAPSNPSSQGVLTFCARHSVSLSRAECSWSAHLLAAGTGHTPFHLADWFVRVKHGELRTLFSLLVTHRTRRAARARLGTNRLDIWTFLNGSFQYDCRAIAASPPRFT